MTGYEINKVMNSFKSPIAPMVLLIIAGGLAWSYRTPVGHWVEATFGLRPLLAAKSWHYQLQNFDLEQLSANTSDLLVIDYAKNGGTVPLTREEVGRLKRKPDGKRRLVVSYFSIGEAEQYRFYWRPEFKDKPARWDMGENCAWPKNHMVKFWTNDWKNIMIRNEDSYLRRIIAAGFDGVYLDRIDAYELQKDGARDYAAEMKAFVGEIKRTGTRLNPGFLVIAQNAEGLLVDPLYRNSIDGLGKEDLLYGDTGTNDRKSSEDIKWSLDRLEMLRADRKPVFTVEYPDQPTTIASALAEHKKLGFVPVSAHRSLDGSNPAAPRKPKEPAATVDPTASSAPAPGTPEYIATVCKDKKWW